MLWENGINLINKLISLGSRTGMTEQQFLEREIAKFKTASKRRDMFIGEQYYNGNHDIMHRRRTIIGEDGKLQEVENLPNNKVIDNQYAKIVDQKVNYLLAKPPTFETENKMYGELLKEVFNNRFYERYGTSGKIH